TAKGVGDQCVAHHQNFHDLFYLAAVPQWLTARQIAAVGRISAIAQAVTGWSLTDTLAARSGDVTQQLGTVFTGAHAAETIASWTALLGTLPDGMTLDELLGFFAADTDAD